MAKTGPHIIRSTPAALAWVRQAPVVVALDNPEALAAAHPDATRVHRHYFEHQLLGADPCWVADQILGSLKGYRHLHLYAQVYVGISAAVTSLYIPLLREVTRLLHAAGVNVAGPSWYTGDYKAEHVQAMRDAGWCDVDLWCLQAYWATKGFTPWNALRYREYWRRGDPPILIGECGRDRVRDGDPAIDGGYIGTPGWTTQGVSGADYVRELVRFDQELQRDPYVVGAAVFSAGPTDDWRAFDTDALDLSPLYVSPGVVPAPLPTPPNGGKQVSDYPRALWVPMPSFGYPTGQHGRQGHDPVAIVDHIAQGYRAGAESRFRNPAERASSNYLVCRNGDVVQYVAEANPAWANGIVQRPDLSIAWLRDAVEHDVNPNLVTISIEHEGFSGQALTEPQYQSSLDLHRDIFKRHGWPVERDRAVGHYVIDGKDRPNDPGPAFNWARLWRDLAGQSQPPAHVDPIDDALNGLAAFGSWAREAASHNDWEGVRRNLDEQWDRLIRLKVALGKQ